jgi:hypothetical protein
MSDSDGPSVTAVYSNYYDLYTNRWTTTSELIEILTEKLDVIHSRTTVVGFWSKKEQVTFHQSSWGTDGNKPVTATGTEITASNFASGSNSGGQTIRYVNIDSPTNRPEAWGLVLKDHPSAKYDADGAFGFVGADYGSSLYPNPYKAKATRFREEHVKRPVSIKNIKFDENSVQAGNYRKGFEIVGTLTTKDQRWWYRKAFADKTDILPPRLRFDHLTQPGGTRLASEGAAGVKDGGGRMYDANGIEIYPGARVTGSAYALGHTTNYMTLFSQLPLTGSESGNVFGPRGGSGSSGVTWNSNRQPDNYELLVGGTQATGSFEMSGAYFPGLYSSGSFEVSGAYYVVPSSGSFDVSGAYSSGTKAVAKFTVTGSQTTGQGGQDTAGAFDGNYITIDGKNFILDDDDSSDSGSNFMIAITPGIGGEVLSKAMWADLQHKIVTNTTISEINRTDVNAAATATITITDYTELNAGDKVNLVATDGTNYDFTQGDQSSVNGTFEATTSN